MTDSTNHAEVIRNWMDHEGGCTHYNTDVPERCNCGYTKALTALDALTRELEAHRSAQPIIRKQLIEQSARIATLEEAGEKVRYGFTVLLHAYSTGSSVSPFHERDMKQALAELTAALAPKEVQG